MDLDYVYATSSHAGHLLRLQHPDALSGGARTPVPLTLRYRSRRVCAKRGHSRCLVASPRWHPVHSLLPVGFTVAPIVELAVIAQRYREERSRESVTIVARSKTGALAHT